MKIILLLVLLFAGVYATHEAEQKMKLHRSDQLQMNLWRKELTREDVAFMKITLSEGQTRSASSSSRIPCSLIVKSGKIIGKSCDESSTSMHPTRHAVLKTIREANDYLGSTSLEGCILYSNTQLCDLCRSIVQLSAADKIVYFATDRHGASSKAYGSLASQPSVQVIPEVSMFPDDLEKPL